MSHTPRYAARRGRLLEALANRFGTDPAARPRSVRRLGLLGLLLVAMLTLTGCVTVQLKANVHSDGTVSGTARVGIAKSLTTLIGTNPADALQSLKADNPCEFGGKAGTTKDFDDGTYVGVDCTFTNVTLAEFNSGEDGPKLAKVGDNFQLTGRLNLLDAIGSGGLLPSAGGANPTSTPTALPSGFPTDLSSLLPSGFPTDLSSLLPSGFPTDLSSLLPSGFPTDLSSLLPSGVPSGALGNLDPTSLLKTAKISFAFTFPGKVASSKGKVSGNTVTFSPDQSGNIDFQTVASAKPATGLTSLSSSNKLGWSVLVVVVLLIAALLAVLVRRRRRGSPVQPAFAGGYPPAGYQSQAQQYPNQQYPNQPTQQYPAQPYPNQPYPNQPYPGAPDQPTQQYPFAQQGQPYGGPPAQPYPNQPTQQYPSPPPPPNQPPNPPPNPPQQWAPPPAEPNPWAAPPTYPDPSYPDPSKPDADPPK